MPPKCFPCGSCMAGVNWCAEPVTPKVRPMFSGKKRDCAPEGHRGVGVQAPTHGKPTVRDRRGGLWKRDAKV
jgi:hypothetical protein